MRGCIGPQGMRRALQACGTQEEVDVSLSIFGVAKSGLATQQWTMVEDVEVLKIPISVPIARP